MDNGRRTALSLLVAASCLRGETPATDQEWSAFIRWVKALKPGMFGNQSEVFPGYQKKAVADGMRAADAEALAARLQERSVDNPEWTAVNSDRMYLQAGDRFVKPDAFLVETIRGLKPGKALDIGMGQGRNAIFLAQQGWDVTGLDLSELAVAEAKERARKLGVRIDARVQDVYRFDFGEGQWDLICLMYFIIPTSHPGLYQRIATALKPGGRVIVEGTGLPPLETLLAERAKWLPTKLRVVRLEYLEGQSAWSRSGNGIGHMILQKPL
jgi:SAM-dependent methyltransferase